MHRTPQSLVLLALGALIAGCAADSKNGMDQSQGELREDASTSSSLPIGSPCNEEDGWQPDPLGTCKPDPCGIDVPEDYVERDDVPPGIGFCLVRGEYPYGYFTMNCKKDADCPGEAACDGELCRSRCQSDADCRPQQGVEPLDCSAELAGTIVCDPPVKCGLGSDDISFCRCADCVLRQGQGPQ